MGSGRVTILFFTLSKQKLLIISEQYYVSGKMGLFFLPLKDRFAIVVAANIYREIGQIIKSYFDESIEVTKDKIIFKKID